MGDVLGFVGQIAGSAIQADATKSAVGAQLAAIQQQRDALYKNLDPAVVNSQATQADVQQVLSQLALQGKIDPALLQARFASQNGLLNTVGTLGQPAAPVATAATNEILGAGPQAAASQKGLIDAAMTQLKQGATLPPDVQAELVKAGLEQTGMTTGAASGQGIGGTIARTILGTAGLQLQQQRQQQAASLLGSAQNLQTQRQSILQQLFPNLTSNQLATLGGQTSAFNTANGAAPNVGLSGTNIANIWLARVGANNALTQNAANVSSAGALANGAIGANLAGGLSRGVGNSLPTLSQLLTAPNNSTAGGSNDYIAGPDPSAVG
jgi:hypothetical protein